VIETHIWRKCITVSRTGALLVSTHSRMFQTNVISRLYRPDLKWLLQTSDRSICTRAVTSVAGCKPPWSSGSGHQRAVSSTQVPLLRAVHLFLDRAPQNRGELMNNRSSSASHLTNDYMPIKMQNHLLYPNLHRYLERTRDAACLHFSSVRSRLTAQTLNPT
jgi:hypothetical protein